MAEHTKVVFKFDQELVEMTEKEIWEMRPPVLLENLMSEATSDKESEPRNVSWKQQTVEVHISAPDILCLNSRLRNTSALLHLVAALIIGLNKYSYKGDSASAHQPSLSEMQTFAYMQRNIVLCIYAHRLSKIGARMRRRKRAHISILPLGFVFVLDQVLSWLMLIICSSTWARFTSESCFNSYSRGYCRRAQLGVATSFVGWAFLLAPTIMTFLRLAGKLRDGMISARMQGGIQNSVSKCLDFSDPKP
ncbi:hypothetical protein R1sor_017390 [Riccia sorocarpa]|uniref:Uncharacterized protein n=1 Tax=Riccia sorocarpa TaxID=122646 RepID=A0ABD3I742_9MARC